MKYLTIYEKITNSKATRVNPKKL